MSSALARHLQRWIERTAEFAPHRIAIELVTAGIAMPLSPRFARIFTLTNGTIAWVRWFWTAARIAPPV